MDISKRKVNITTQLPMILFTIRLFRKNPNVWLSWYNFLKTPHGIFRYATSPLENPEKTRFYPCWKFCRIVVWHAWKFQHQKPRPWKFHMSFSWTPLEIPLLLIDPWNFLIFSVWKQWNRSQKLLQNIYMFWEKEIYFLYMWTSKRVKKYSPPPTHATPPSPKVIHNYLQNCPKFHETSSPPSLLTQWHLRCSFSKKNWKKSTCAIIIRIIVTFAN